MTWCNALCVLLASFIVGFVVSYFLPQLWRLLPDRCDMAGHGCCRKGVRGNENRVGLQTLCDYCVAARKASTP